MLDPGCCFEQPATRNPHPASRIPYRITSRIEETFLLAMRSHMKKALSTFLLFLPTALVAQQEAYYFHTIHSSSLAAMYGRTYKVHYAYQLTHSRQLKLSGLYVFDEYTQNNNRIEADLYNLNVQFQYNLAHVNKVFFGIHLGVGGYLLKAVDLIGLEQKERKINFVGGVQGEYYVRRNSLAIVVDYDILYLPFSDIYEFLHVPTLGVGLFF